MTGVSDGRERVVDVAIVGAGPAGITIAGELSRSGRRVALIEAGVLAAAGREHRRQQRHLRGHSVGTPFPLSTARACGFGGTSNKWTPATGLRTRPLDHVDFEPLVSRPGTQWPFRRAVLDPYYARAAELLGIGDDYASAAWYSKSPASRLAGDGHGLAYFQFADFDVFTSRYGALHADPNIDMMLGNVVNEVVVAADGSVERLRLRTAGGARLSIRASVVVLAGGAIENARTLLESPGLSGAGVGNEHDQVGRYFMDHISVDSGVIVPTDGAAFDTEAFEQRHDERGIKFQPMLWLGDEAVREHGLLNAAFWVNRLDRAYLSDGVDAARSLRDGVRVTPHFPNAGRHLRRALLGIPDIARLASSRVREGGAERQCLALRILAEQVPDAKSRITLDKGLAADGRRRVTIDWRINEIDLRMIRRHQDLLALELERRGVGTVADRLDLDRPLPFFQSNHHHVGGTRMGADPQRSVVDAECRVHSARNLYVAGSSVFPTGGYLNPTLTIIALAIRIADSINRELAACSTASG